MVALMGATGAGKKTLMDVIAGRKTGGRAVVDIIVNGCGGLRCVGVLSELAPAPTFTDEERTNLVSETLELLELSPIASEMLGRLSVEQKKRETIGVEVNPSILFLDEPTSDLDTR
ncbi:hypothetical protein PHYPSEUDO_004329 [Phytophthora pseudosyringae]|uniref:ABC transporter domain-containing protein n=1 Tax=Phytophthora pseudosyringae TaxID=221518 RepID=A0A8T1VNT9_9STRA|nr:hypothetical protein PHYPSEUDO_004329 [Phytophthora pseudosyringae]